MIIMEFNTIKIKTPDGKIYYIEYEKSISEYKLENGINNMLNKIFNENKYLISELNYLRVARFKLQEALYSIIDNYLEDEEKYNHIWNYDFKKMWIPYISDFIKK